MIRKVTAGQYIVNWMEQMEIDRFFFVPGESFLPVLDALLDSEKIQAITTRHESSASYAAEAYGKLKGKPAVCMATRGPGASNLSIGVQTAYYDQTPLIALIGQVPTASMQSGAFQEVDFVSFFKPISKEVFSVTTLEQLPAILRQAYWLACNGRPGPVVITLPTDILGMELEDELLPEAPPLFFSKQENEIAFSILDKLEKASQPLIVSALPAVRGEESLLLSEVAELLGVPVCGAWRRFSSFPNDHSSFIGSVGLGSPQVTSNAVKEADCIIGFGQSMEDIAINGGSLISDYTEIVQVSKHIDSGNVRRSGKSTFQGCVASELGVLNALLQICKDNKSLTANIREKNGSRTSSLRELFENRFSEVDNDTEKANLDLVFNKLNQALETNAIVTSDAGNFSHWLLRYISFQDERVYLGPVNGSMGYAIPSALGANVSYSDCPVWAFAGDGGAMMTIGDLETIKRYNLNVTVVVINNGIYGTIQAHQEKQFPNRNFGTSIGEVDFAKVAEGMGLKTWKIKTNADIESVLTEVVQEKGARLIEVSTSVYPIGLT